MNNIDFTIKHCQAYKITSLVAYVTSAVLFCFFIYKETLYVDQTWFHGFFANFVITICSLAMCCILYVFSKFLINIVTYKRANTLIYYYIGFTILSTISVTLVMISSLEIYFQKTDVNSMINFAQTSSSSAMFMIFSRIGLFFSGILLGVRILKINYSKNLIFKILGVLFIVYKLIAVLESVNIIKVEIISGFINVAVIAIIGYLLSSKFEIIEKENKSFEPIIDKVASRNSEILSNELNDDYSDLLVLENEILENNSKEIDHIDEEITELDIKQFKNGAVYYYNNLADDEKARLKYIVSKKNDSVTIESELYKLIILYIIEKKLFDNNRFAPK